MSKNRGMGGDALSTLDNCSDLSGATALSVEKKPSGFGKFCRTVRNLGIIGALVWGGYEVGNHKASEAKKESAMAKADLVEANVQLDIAHEKIKEAVANSDVKAARSLYAKEILKAAANKPKAHPYDVVGSVFASIRKESKVPTYVMDPVEAEISRIGNHITKLTPTNAGSNFIAVMANYSSMTGFIDSSSTTEQINQVILNLHGPFPATQSVAKNTGNKLRNSGSQKSR